MGDEKVNSSVEAGRGRNPSDGGGYEGVYTATFPPSYGSGYGDYQFKVPFGHEEFRNKERIVTDPELPTVTDLVTTRGIRYDPEYSKKHGKVKGPIKRREMQLDPSTTSNIDKTGLFMIPTGKRTPSGYNVTHTTEFGGRTDVFPGLDKDEIFLDSLATSSGRQLMRKARLSELGPGFEGMPRRIGEFYDGPVGDFLDGETFWDRMKGVPIDIRVAARKQIDDAMQAKFKSVAGFTDAMISDPSAMDRFIDETTQQLADKLLEWGYEKHPTLANNTARTIVRKATTEYVSRIPYFENSDLWHNHRDALLQAAQNEKSKRAFEDITLLNELDAATRVGIDDENIDLVGSDRLRELADRSLDRFGYVPEYITMYNPNLFTDYSNDIGGAMRFLLPQEPDLAIYRGQRIVDQPHKLKGQSGAHERWESKTFDNRKGKSNRFVKRPGDLLYAAAKFPQTRGDYYTAQDVYKMGREKNFDAQYLDAYREQLYRTAKSQLQNSGVTITDDIDNELKNLVNHRIEQYKDGTLRIPYPSYNTFQNEPVIDNLLGIETRRK